MKKVIIMLFMSLLMVLPLKVKAISLDKDSIILAPTVTENIGIYANVEQEVKEIHFTLVYSSYDAPANYSIEPGLTDSNPNGISHRIILATPQSGKIKLGTIKVNVVNQPTVDSATASIHSVKAITINDEEISLNSQNINITIEKTQQPGNEDPTIEQNNENNNVNNDNNNNNIDNNVNNQTTNVDEEKEDEEEKVTNLLEKIESKIVNIKLRDDVYEYTVEVLTGVEELDLKPIAKDKAYEVNIESQKISELKDNTIKITVKNKEYTEEYKIKVKVVEKIEETNVEIDEQEFEGNHDYRNKWIFLIGILIVVLIIGLLMSNKK